MLLCCCTTRTFREIRNIEVDGGVARPRRRCVAGIHVQATTAGACIGISS